MSERKGKEKFTKDSNKNKKNSNGSGELENIF